MLYFRLPIVRSASFNDGYSPYMPPLTRIAQHERRRPRVVGPGAVVLDAAAELGPQQHDHVVGLVVLAVREERGDGLETSFQSSAWVASWLAWVSKLPCAV